MPTTFQKLTIMSQNVTLALNPRKVLHVIGHSCYMKGLTE